MNTRSNETEVAIRDSIYSSKRELRKFSEEQRIKGKMSDGAYISAVGRRKEKIALLEEMLDKLLIMKNARIPKIVSPPIKHFSSTEQRFMPIKPYGRPHFYMSDNEWDFGIESRQSAKDMSPFGFDRYDDELTQRSFYSSASTSSSAHSCSPSRLSPISMTSSISSSRRSLPSPFEATSAGSDFSSLRKNKDR